MNAAITKITNKVDELPKNVAILSPNTADAPVSFITSDKAIPPPKSINTPQSVLSEICFQLTKPSSNTATAANKAMTVSGLLKPKTAPNCLPKIQQAAVAIKIIVVKMRGKVIGMASLVPSSTR